MSQEKSLVYVIAVTVKNRNYCAELYSWIVAWPWENIHWMLFQVLSELMYFTLYLKVEGVGGSDVLHVVGLNVVSTMFYDT